MASRRTKKPLNKSTDHSANTREVKKKAYLITYIPQMEKTGGKPGKTGKRKNKKAFKLRATTTHAHTHRKRKEDRRGGEKKTRRGEERKRREGERKGV